MPITVSKYSLTLTASIAISALNYSGITKVPRILTLLASPAVLLLHVLYEYAQLRELQRQTEELRAKNRRYKAQKIALDIAMEELCDGFDDLDNEAKILAIEETIKMLQEFAERTGILED
ncbi:uncharacterized protein J4E78_004652 [Alternaria triticimaculans]|uniref:uncharacterized protein n=1 Tax=Alternaria triticimaculans TaxID=297637 RepID=UPI0020C29B41|nr:uncharacterized protein J4E78_004652 [Alternaria triticimaculans]KAI4661862.1 hypothetical protein J4E78_004652 [Alternaria triticimaculans]